MTDTDASLLVDRLRLHAYDLLNGGTNAGDLRNDLNLAAAALRRSGEALRRLQEEIEQLSSIQVGSPDPSYFEATPLIRRQDVLDILSRQSGAVKTER